MAAFTGRRNNQVKELGSVACRLYIVRHGETVWNHALRYQGHADIPLNDRGIQQAHSLGRRLQKENFDAFYASDLKRAYDTASIIASYHGGKVEARPALREINFGRWEGLRRDEIKARFSEIAEQWWSTPLTTRLPDGESLQDVVDRAVGALREIAARHPDGRVLVVSHGGTIRACIGYLLGLDLNTYWRLRQDNAALNIVDYLDDTRAVLVLFNDTSHLQET